MEYGVLFSKAEKSERECQKLFWFGETPRSAFWDRQPEKAVTQEEAKHYDAVMRKYFSKQFF